MNGWEERRAELPPYVSDPVGGDECLRRLYWFFQMVDSGGPDGTELDTLVYDEATAAALWLEREHPEAIDASALPAACVSSQENEKP